MKVWMVRHGQSGANAGLPSEDPATSPLTDTGWRQAACVAAQFSEPPGLIVGSPYVRAQQTAEPTRARFPLVPYEEWPVQEFTYLGILRGRETTYEQRQELADDFWQRADPGFKYEGTESYAELLGRVQSCLDALAGRSEEFVAVFSHGIFIRAMLWTLFLGSSEPSPESMRGCQRFFQTYLTPNGCIVELSIDAARGPVMLGSVQHLPSELVTGGW